jgi:septum site-determining protein MinC
MQAPPELQSNHPAVHSGIAGSTGATGSAAAFELKGVVAPLTVLRLRSTDVRIIERQLRVRIAEMPQFFSHAPVLLDLGALGPMARALDFFGMAAALRACHMVPVAITNASDEIRGSAAEAGFGFVAPPSARLAGRSVAGEASGPPDTAGTASLGASTPAPELDKRPTAGAAAPSRAGSGAGAAGATTTSASGGPSSSTQVRAAPPRPHRPPLVIRQPVRSGQIIYAERNDVVVLAPVNPGAEVIADGNVHIYAPLRGRVVAGAQGFTDARIFCQRLEAELVAIAGAYMLADDIPAEYRGKPAQVYLEDGHCRVAAL